MDPAESGRAVSQLHSVLRDLGIATRGLARYQTTGRPADPASLEFSRLVAASAQQLVKAWESLDGVIAAEGLGPVPDPDEPGAVLCRAARNAITAWRQPIGTSADRDTTVERLVTAIGCLSTATQCLITHAPRQRTIELHAVDACLAKATACLARAIQPPADYPAPRLGRRRHGRWQPVMPGDPALPARDLSCRSWPDRDGPVNHVGRPAGRSFPPNSVLEAVAAANRKSRSWSTAPSRAGPRICVTNDGGTAQIRDRQGESPR